MPISSTCLVQVDGTDLPTDIAGLLTDAFVDDSQRLPDMFTLRFRDVGRTVVAKSRAKIGAKVKISVQTVDARAPVLLMEGEVTAIEAEFDSAGTFTVIRGYDPAHRLFHGRRTAAYTQVTAADVVTTVVQRAGLATGSIAATRTVHEQVSQCGQTDWEFLEGVAREEGMDLWVRKGKVHFAPPEDASSAPAPGGPGTRVPLALRLGQDLLRVRTVISSAQQVKEVEVRGWDVKTKAALTATEPARTDTLDLGVDAQQLAKIFGDRTYVSTDVPFGTQAQVGAAAKSLAREVASSFASVEGLVRGNPELGANCAITLAGLGSPFDGKYTVTSARHRFDATTGYLTSFTVSGRNDRTMLGLSSSAPGASGLDSPVIGVVSDIKDPEKMGRVKVTMPWLDKDYVSPWARTVHAGAGNDRGWLVMPEVGDEVLVAFEQGDVRSPFVLGGLYNGKDKHPAKGPELIDGGKGAANRRSMVSRLGHRIELLDQKGQADGVTVATADDKLLLTLDAAGTKITLHSDGTVLIEGTKGIVVDAANANLDLKGGKVTIAGQQGVEVTSKAGVKVNATTQLELTGLSAKLQGNTQTEVKGGATCAISAAMVRIN